MKSFRPTAKGLALVAAIETGLLPEIEQDGETGYDDELFQRFWTMFQSQLRNNQIHNVLGDDGYHGPKYKKR